jgi:hypothetical protein
MRPTLLKATIKSLFPVKRTVAVEGPPGGGKTTVIREVAKELAGGGRTGYAGICEVLNDRFGYVEKHMPTMLVEDFGIPDLAGGDNSTFGYKVPDWFPAVYRDDMPEEGILCFDDRNQCGADLQKVLANICQARNLHGVRMKEGWMVISTGNRQQDRAGANKVLSHLRGRETVYNYETHLDDWTQWAIDNGVKPEVISFMRFKPGMLHDFDPNRDINPSPRSWVEGVSDVIGLVPAEAEYESFSGTVGEGPAAEFTGYMRIFRKLPNPDVILMNPATSDVPTDPATLYALAGSLAHRATTANFERVCTYVERMPPEFSVLSVSMAARRDSSLASTAAFAKWAVAHQDVLF